MLNFIISFSMQLKELISWGKKRLDFLPNAEKEVIDLCSFFLKKRRSDLSFWQEVLSDEKKEQLIFAIEQRAKKIPFAYITKEVEFYGCTLFINENVLIPRPETEILIDHIVKEIKTDKGVVWDFCTGSGAIGIALKKKIPSLEVVISDISLEALEVARINAKKNQVEVEVRQSDLFANFRGQCDFFICNPPYLKEEEYKEELLFEPKISLVAPEQGYFFYQKIAKELPFFLKKNGKAFLEIGASQKKRIEKIFSSYEVRVEEDWARHPRFLFLK